jgi:DNA-binding MarR family transcriptional regulator
MASGTSNDATAEAIIISLLRVINKIQQGRRIPRDYGNGVSMTLLEAEMCALIARQAGVTGSELSEELGVTRSAMSQVIAKLKGKDLVTEEVSDSHAKRKHVYLTQRGRDAAAIAENFKSKMRDELFGESRAELQSYLRFVTKLEAFHSETVKDWQTGDV